MRRKVVVVYQVHNIKTWYVMSLEDYDYIYIVKTNRPLKKKLTKGIFFKVGYRKHFLLDIESGDARKLGEYEV